MSNLAATLGKKTFGLALIFNSILSLVSSIRILKGFYDALPWWRPFYPYLIDGSLFWIVIPTSILNLAPARAIGDAKIKRIVFHHYVYGFFVLLLTSLSTWTITLIQKNSLSMFFNSENRGSPCLLPYIEMFFIYGGLTLILDDLSDISPNINKFLNWLKVQTNKFNTPIRLLYTLCSLITLYISISICLWTASNIPLLQWLTIEAISYLVLMGSLFVTGILGLNTSIKGKISNYEGC